MFWHQGRWIRYLLLYISCNHVYRKIPFNHTGFLKILYTPFFLSVMPFNWYELQWQILHYVDNYTLDPSDHLTKLRYSNDYCKNKFQGLYSPVQNITIDESLKQFHGRLPFVQLNTLNSASFAKKYYKCVSLAVDTVQFGI
jgi:hypothetical protein